MKIIQKRERHESTSYSLSFRYESEAGAGYAFDCDKDGKVDVEKLNPCAQHSYQVCMSGIVTRMVGMRYWRYDDEHCEPILCTGSWLTEKILNEGVKEYHHSWTEPAAGECECGEVVVLDGFTNTCQCERDYNMSGQLLAPRECWGEETGESLSDILSIP